MRWNPKYLLTPLHHSLLSGYLFQTYPVHLDIICTDHTWLETPKQRAQFQSIHQTLALAVSINMATRLRSTIMSKPGVEKPARGREGAGEACRTSVLARVE